MKEREAPQTSKPIVWLGDSLEKISNFPMTVKKELGYALRQTQMGATHPNAKPLHGNLSGVMEIGANDVSGTYRAVYTAKLAGTIYVLHCFQKKSKKGIATLKRDLLIIQARLKLARETHEST